MFDPTEFQDGPNGPLNSKTISRLAKIKDTTGMSFQALGDKLSISGTFLHNLMKKNANVGTQHVERIVSAIEALENPSVPAVNIAENVESLRHSFHLRPGLQIQFELPADLTPREAERLSQFIQSLPVS
ncbi:hypothetical protein FY134_03075 [Agrobacterium fabrum]|uniref:hypothetical protein n=1 Tax=Agrobacterium fabrum TaxID=1176649 RepID=UPI0021CEB86B|nr:hypothetical protein [Agrobacterium fabrum]UXT56681.1 hypothetical protein FY134_03075 [Agrobacterium fabrum]